MAVEISGIDYDEAYKDDVSLYGEHFRAMNRFQTAASLDSMLLPFERRIVHLLREADLHSIVDLGCGTGRFLRAAEMAGIDALGFEVARVLVERLASHGRRVNQGGIEEFLDSDSLPEAISLLEVVEHLPEPGSAIDRLLARKQPKQLFVVVPDSVTRRRYDSRFAAHDVPPNHVTWWDRRSLSTLLERSGYKVRVETVPESRRSLLGHIARNRNHPPAADTADWLRALVSPPTFWLLGIAERP